MIGFWVSLGYWIDKPCLWMTILSAIDIGLILRFTGISPGWPRYLGVVVGTVIITVCSQWLIASNVFGLVMGIPPLETAQMIGPVLVWEFTRLRIAEVQMIYPIFALLLAWYLGFRFPK